MTSRPRLHEAMRRQVIVGPTVHRAREQRRIAGEGRCTCGHVRDGQGLLSQQAGRTGPRRRKPLST